MNLSPDRLAFFFAVLVMLGGYAFVARPFEASISRQYDRLDAERDLLKQRLSLARHAATLARERDALVEHLAHVGSRESTAVLVDRFLHTVAATADRDDIHLEAVAAVNQAAVPAPSPSGGLEEIPLRVSCRGRYHEILRLLRDLDRASLATRVGVELLENAQRPTAIDPQLHATLHVVLLREATGTAKGSV